MELPSVSNLSVKEQLAKSGIAYRLDLAYIGTEFLGWQSQPHGNTVQDQLERALGIVLREKIRVLGASRTDTGVHAEHQVATFKSLQTLDCKKIQRSLSAVVPPGIGIYSLRPMEKDFHPIVHARSKLYRYRIWQGAGLSPFVKPYVWNIPQSLNLPAMREATQLLVGRHNFKSFCASDASVKTFERTLFELQWMDKGPLLELYVLGDGFLKQMVRSLLGTLVEVGLEKRPPGDIRTVLQAQDRSRAGQTAPALGLSLVNIYYEDQKTIPEAYLAASPLLGFNLQPISLKNPIEVLSHQA